MIDVKFYGIDSWNRPIFKQIDKKSYYGSFNKLFTRETEEEILKEIKASDLTWFGTTFDCEPYGSKPTDDLRIIPRC